MANVDQSPIDRAFDAINDETVEEDTIEVEESEDAIEESFEEDPLSEDTEETFDADEDSSDVDEEIEEENSSAEKFVWDGNIDTLPPENLQIYKQQQAGWTRKTQEMAELRKQYEDGIRQNNEFLANQRKAQSVVDDPRPDNPMTDWDDQRAQEQWDKISQWNARKERRTAMENGELSDPAQYEQFMAEQKEIAGKQRRIGWLQSQPDYAKLEDSLISVIIESDYWKHQANTDDGIQEFYKMVKTQVEAAETKAQAAKLETAKVKRQAGSGKRSTPKPSSKKAAVENYSKNFDGMTPQEKIGAIIDGDYGT